mmetsp:Transcript_50547/g.113789  ORF Transcript_50547/g.113789 Transcript_50547/m.113789 type:complete len:188 (+) Transcript_50547:41-604(+)
MAERVVDFARYCSAARTIECDAGSDFRKKYDEALAAIKSKHAGASPEFADDDMNASLTADERSKGWIYPLTKTEQLKEFGCVFMEQQRFMQLVQEGDLETLQALFEDDKRAKAIDVNRYDNEGYTALHYAAWNDLPEVVELLLDNGAEPFQRDLRTGLVPLELAEVGIDRQSGPNWNCIDVLKSVME